jgi:putative transposase
MARAVLPGVPHHLTQRGLNRQDIFFDAADYEVYLSQIRQSAACFGASLLGYCCMTSHVHWVVAPNAPGSLARTFGEAHGRYAAYANGKPVADGTFS